VRFRRASVVALVVVLAAATAVSSAGSFPLRDADHAAAAKSAAKKKPKKKAKRPTRTRLDAVLQNSSFETSLAGWEAWNGTLSRVANGAVGTYSARVRAGKNVPSFSITPSPAQVASTTAGTAYVGAAWVRTDKPGRQICARIREWNGSTVSGSAVKCVAGSSSWTRLEGLTLTAVGNRKLDLYVYVSPAVRYDVFDVDGVTLAARAPEPTPPPTAPPAPASLAATSITDTAATLTWSASTGATSYSVLNGSATLGSTASTSFAATGLTCGTALTLSVVAVGTGGTSAPSSVSFTTGACATPAPVPSVSCTKIAAPGGTDSAAGTAAAPLATLGGLLAALAPGQTGCLRAGSYNAVSISKSGAQGSPITITSYPGERAKIVGRLVVSDNATDLVFSNLDLNGNTSGLPSPTVNGDRITFAGNDVTNDHTAICFDLGSVDGYGTAIDVVIDGNRIHDCGKLPATNHDHGIYVEKSRNARIVNNVIYDNADRGVQFYPDAQGTLVAHNVIDGNGSGIIFSGELGFASSDNTVRDNVITNSVLRYNVESWWASGNPVGTGNVASHNCVFNGKQGNFDGGSGYTLSGNVTADPLFVDRAGKDFRLRADSPCAGMGPA
jgi:parallel beta-helix repeat protein